MLIGLAAKNAILIVEFAKQNEDNGMSVIEAARHAAAQRLRPILMTSFAFILRVVPLVVATGAGFEMRRALGTAVFSGMLGVTIFGIFLTPVFFLIVDRVSHWSIFSGHGPLSRIGRILTDVMRLRFLTRPIRAAVAAIPTEPRGVPSTHSSPAINPDERKSPTDELPSVG